MHRTTVDTSALQAAVFILSVPGAAGLAACGGGGPGELTEPDPDEPTAPTIAFVSDRGGNRDTEIWRMNLDATGLTQLTDTENGRDGEPNWRPEP